MKVLLTGASGFVGRSVLETARQNNFHVLPVYRSVQSIATLNTLKDPYVIVPTLLSDTCWMEALLGVNVVIHCASLVRPPHNNDVDMPMALRSVNVEGTLNLARQAVRAGVKRFVFISSIKVNGECTSLGSPYTANDPPAPVDPYGISKAQAESGLRQLSRETGLEVVIIRPPLVYGMYVKGNFRSLISWLVRGLPFPLGRIRQNRRSMVSLDNLVNLILICLEHPKAANQTFLVSDGEDLSTAELLERMGKALNRQVYLLNVPVNLLSLAACLLGKRAVAQRLLGSLQVDTTKTRQLLD